MMIETKYLPENRIYKFANNMYIMTRFKDAIYKGRHIKKEVSTVFEINNDLYNELAKGIIVGIPNYDINTERFRIIDDREDEYVFNIEFPLEEVSFQELLSINNALVMAVDESKNQKQYRL